MLMLPVPWEVLAARDAEHAASKREPHTRRRRAVLRERALSLMS
jgi:hypothetical protein